MVLCVSFTVCTTDLSVHVQVLVHIACACTYLGSLDHDCQEGTLPEWRHAPVYAHVHVVTVGSYKVMLFQELGYYRMMTWTHEISKG